MHNNLFAILEMSLKVAFLDTNIYLHYQPFDQIDWAEVLTASEVTIVIPTINVLELNKQKDTARKPRVRKRAKLVQTKLLELFKNESSAMLRANVRIVLEDRFPRKDLFSELQLNSEIQDDQLIASVVLFQKENPKAEIVLVTADDGILLISKARHQNINAIQLPEKYKLADEPDEEQTRIRELENELRKHELKIPRLSLLFESDQNKITLRLQPPVDIAEDEIAKKLDSVKSRYPKVDVQPKEQNVPQEGLSLLLRSLAEATSFEYKIFTPEAREKYNTELDEFYQAYSAFLRSDIRYTNMQRRTITLILYVANDGTVPAEDIDVQLHLPDGMDVVEEYPNRPEPPTVPQKPMEKLQFLPSEPLLFDPSIMNRIPRMPSPYDVSDFNIKRTNSYDVDFFVPRVKHNCREGSKPLHIIFESFETAKSFQIDYKLLADNVPEPVTGKLHVIINKE